MDDAERTRGFLLAGFSALGTFLVVVLVGVAVLGVGLDRPVRGQDGPGGGDTRTLSQGELVYESRCASCHGPAGEGGVGPAMTGVAARYPDPADQVELVVAGRGQMPAFGEVLSPESIEAVVAYEREVLGG